MVTLHDTTKQPTTATNQNQVTAEKSCWLRGMHCPYPLQDKGIQDFLSSPSGDFLFIKYSFVDRLVEEISKHPTLIVIGETGSGKTTQVDKQSYDQCKQQWYEYLFSLSQIPQFIFTSSISGSGTIAVTQPRRVAAITLATRVADEMNAQLGTTVGYTVRFEDMSNFKTKIKFLTDGMLLREAMLDPLLKKYSVVILDEAHERTIHTDVLFSVVKSAQKRRAEQKSNLLKVSHRFLSTTRKLSP